MAKFIVNPPEIVGEVMLSLVPDDNGNMAFIANVGPHAKTLLATLRTDGVLELATVSEADRYWVKSEGISMAEDGKIMVV